MTSTTGAENLNELAPLRLATAAPVPNQPDLGRPGMRIDALEAYDIEPQLLDIWRTTVGPRLLPVQERAVKEFGLFGGGNLVVFSPTSSGKTFIGEMAGVHAARAGSRVFYLVPQRALAAEKFNEFRGRYRPVGIDVVVSSRDHREYDRHIRNRAFDIAVVVFEKLQGLIVSQPDLLNEVGLVVVDELQLLTDRERGPALELLLTKLRTAARPPRLIGLSAVLGQADLLTDWLEAKLLIDHRRPVELRKGVLSCGEFRYREHNSGRVGSEPFRDFFAKERDQLMLSAAEDLIERGEQVLLFVPDRTTAVITARTLASRVKLPIASQAVEELADTENTRMREVLRETLESSVAFHHADMTADEREIVERAFRTGHLRGLVATSTLAMGVNLPAKNVILDGRKWVTNGAYARPHREDLSKSEYENMSGRAGRLAFTSDFGRSILVTHSRFQARTWLDNYVTREFEDITPTLKDAPLTDLVLDLVATQKACTKERAASLLLASFTGRVHWNEKLGQETFLKALDQAVAECLEGGLVRAAEDGRLVVTRVGKVAAGSSMGARTAIVFADWARQPQGVPPAAIEVLTLLGHTPAGEDVYVRLTWKEDRDNTYKADLLHRVSEDGLAERPVFKPYTSTRMALEDDEGKAVKKALALFDWIEEVPTREIEDRYETWAGSLKRIGEEYAWLCEGLAAMCGACGWTPALRRSIEAIGERLTFGVKEDALPVMRLRVPRLGRGMVPGLRSAGLLDIGSLRDAAEVVVRKAIGRRAVADALRARVALDMAETAGHGMVVSPRPSPASAAKGQRCEDREEPDGGSGPQTAPLGEVPRAAEPVAGNVELSLGDRRPPPAATAPGPDLVIDVEGRQAILWGQPIRKRPPRNLSPHLFFALIALGLEAGKVVPMAELAVAIQRVGQLARRPVAPDPRDLRYRLLRSLGKALEGDNKERLSALVETVPGFGLRLTGTVRVLGEGATVDSVAGSTRR